MASLPYMQLYVADYLADTAHLSTVEHGAYLLLIFNYWQRGESFKAKDEQTLNKRLATVARMSNEEWLTVKETLSEFFVIDENEWKHERIERDLIAVNSKASKASAAGKASAKARAQRRGNERSTDVKQTLNHTDTDTDTDTDTEKRERGARFVKPAFEEIAAYIKQKNYNVDPVIFFNHYEANGWVVGKAKMKSWQSCLANWNARENKATQAKPEASARRLKVI